MRMGRFFVSEFDKIHAKLDDQASSMEAHVCVSQQALSSLHWLPVKFRIEFKILLLVFKCLYGLAPNYLQEQITIRNHQRHSLRSANKFLLNYLKGKMLSTSVERVLPRLHPGCGMPYP